ncbi:CoA transferase [Actinomadura sp. NBRC 104412]|nr:CoA transferase [Actinomadura sp. NBRC 104412]
MGTAALAGIRVLDFSTLLPGPFATLLLATAGAEVTKVERPGGGDEMRSYTPRFGTTSANFAILNAGKRSLAIDLKDPAQRERLRGALRDTDVLVEQFRPGVMARLGLDYPSVREVNPRLVYCSITGYGQEGERAGDAGHDLNYLAETGMLDLCRDATGSPPLPPVLVADLAGGAYPAVLNILLALRARESTGTGMHLDVNMSANLFPLMYWAWAGGHATGAWPVPGGELVTGGSPRYQVYRTADGRHLAAAPLEERFWRRFCDLIGLGESERDDRRDPAGVRAAVAERIARHDAEYWRRRFAGQDVCCSVVRTLPEALADPAMNPGTRAEVADGEHRMPALPMPVGPGLAADPGLLLSPGLGRHGGVLEEARRD